MNPRIRKFIAYAESASVGDGIPYQQAVDLGRAAEWWRNCAMHLYEYMLSQQMLPADEELDAAEECPEHFDRCGDS